MLLLNFVPLMVIVGALIAGFKIAGRWAKSVPMQILIGLMLGFAIMIGVVCVLCGVLVAGCVIMGSPKFH